MTLLNICDLDLQVYEYQGQRSRQSLSSCYPRLHVYEGHVTYCLSETELYSDVSHTDGHTDTIIYVTSLPDIQQICIKYKQLIYQINYSYIRAHQIA